MRGITRRQRTGALPALTARHEEILKTVYFYRYMKALDVAYLLFSPSSLTHVRSELGKLAGGGDNAVGQYLYRFPMPHTGSGNPERVFTLGAAGRHFLAEEVGLPVDWYFRPDKVKHLSYAQLTHNLLLTRFLVAAHLWCRKQPDWRLSKVRICYELERLRPGVRLSTGAKAETQRVVPDAWLLFERLKEGAHARFFPVLLEIDRGTEHQLKFKKHVASRIEFIRTGGYEKLFGTPAVLIAYVTTGDTPSYRQARRIAMCRWTNDVLADLHKESWAGVFRFHSLSPDELYTSNLFAAPVWYRPDRPEPLSLFPP